MPKIYVAARPIPGGWPEEGRAINDASPRERRLVLDGDLTEKPAETAEKPKKD